MNITKMLSKNTNHFKGVNKRKYITIHQTGNKSKSANAIKHANYINNGSPTSWHYTVDDTQIVQHYLDTVQCWHCGDGSGTGNTQSIGIELCINEGSNYLKTILNGVELVQLLMKKYNIPITNVVQHNKWSGKHCPQQIRENYLGLSWNDFINKVKNISSITHIPPTPSHDQLIKELAIETIQGKHGNGDTRKRSLGVYYNDVQKQVNIMLTK